MEEWAALKAKAMRRASMMAQGQGQARGGRSMDDDGGGSGSEGNWTAAEAEAEGEGPGGLFEGVPVGIREFMRTEKRLKERHRRETEGSLGG